MTWVITRVCRDCLDTSCIEVCPVDCIYEYVGPASASSRTSFTSTPTSASAARRASLAAPGRRHCATPRCPQCSTTHRSERVHRRPQGQVPGAPAHRQAPADYQRRRRQQAQVGLGRLKVRSRRGRGRPASAQRSSGASAPPPRHRGRRPVTTGRLGRWGGSASTVARDDRRSELLCSAKGTRCAHTPPAALHAPPTTV